MSETFEELIGRTIKSVRLSEDKTELGFEFTDEGGAVYVAEGGCCLTSWIEHVNGLQALIGNQVNGIVEHAMSDVRQDDYTSIASYGWTIETSAGRCDIEMRNELNGYYGGYLTRGQLADLDQLPILSVDI